MSNTRHMRTIDSYYGLTFATSIEPCKPTHPCSLTKALYCCDKKHFFGGGGEKTLFLGKKIFLGGRGQTLCISYCDTDQGYISIFIVSSLKFYKKKNRTFFH